MIINLICNDNNFNELCSILKEKNLWDEELESIINKLLKIHLRTNKFVGNDKKFIS